MNKGLKVVCLIGVAFSMIGATVATMMPTGAATTATTTVSATVTGTISCNGGSVAIGEITPGGAKSATATLSVTTNSATGFKVTTGTLGNLASGSNNIAYNASAAAGTQGWKAVVTPTTDDVWSGLGSGNVLTSGAVLTHAKYSATAVTESVAVTVGTTGTTQSGSYSGSIGWTCATN